jgi:TonB-dependent SusC/RagA subfamily outer membrane receptor
MQQIELLNYGKIKGKMLKEVTIHGKRPDDHYRTTSLAGAGNADQVMHAEEIERVQGSLITSLNGRLRGVTFVSAGLGIYKPYLTINLAGIGQNAAKPMLVIMDGAEVAPEDISFIDVNLEENIEVLKYASAGMYGMEGGGGVLIITTKQGRGLNAKDIPSVGILPITITGFYKAREFYSPRYDNPALNSRQRDFRSTIFWKPELKTDKNGDAAFDFYNADGAGTYKVTVEGIDNKGNIGRQVYRYKVE